MPPAEPSTHHTLYSVVERLRAGASAADDPALARRLDEAFGRYVPALRKLCARELDGAPAQEVEEAVQQVLLVAWSRLTAFRGESRFRTWLFGIATHTCANQRRRRRELLSADGAADPPDPTASVLERLGTAERDEVLRRAAESALDATEQEIVYLRYVVEASAEEIARNVGLPSVDAVRVALQRCQRRLRRALEVEIAALGHGASFLRDER